MGQNSDRLDIERKLKKKGYVLVRQNGSHMIYEHPWTHKHYTVNLKLNREVYNRLDKELENEC